MKVYKDKCLFHFHVKLVSGFGFFLVLRCIPHIEQGRKREFGKILIISINIKSRPVVAQGQSVSVKATGCEFDTHSRKLNIYLNVYIRSGIKTKRGVEFRQITRNASRIRRKVGNGVS